MPGSPEPRRSSLGTRSAPPCVPPLLLHTPSSTFTYQKPADGTPLFRDLPGARRLSHPLLPRALALLDSRRRRRLPLPRRDGSFQNPLQHGRFHRFAIPPRTFSHSSSPLTLPTLPSSPQKHRTERFVRRARARSGVDAGEHTGGVCPDVRDDRCYGFGRLEQDFHEGVDHRGASRPDLERRGSRGHQKSVFFLSVRGGAKELSCVWSFFRHRVFGGCEGGDGGTRRGGTPTVRRSPGPDAHALEGFPQFLVLPFSFFGLQPKLIMGRTNGPPAHDYTKKRGCCWPLKPN